MGGKVENRFQSTPIVRNKNSEDYRVDQRIQRREKVRQSVNQHVPSILNINIDFLKLVFDNKWYLSKEPIKFQTLRITV